MHLARFPRRRYTPYLTPIERLDHLSSYLGGANLYVKRDDLLGLAGGGNKTRKLEFLVADALDQGADTLITNGAVQSNHCRLTLAAAVKEGLRCRLVLEKRVPGSYDPSASGNYFLLKLLGVEKITVTEASADLNAIMEEIAAELAAEGRQGYIIPGGGSNPLGALGYIACAEEILQQTFELGLAVDRIVASSGSGGTHAGLVAGLHGNSAGIEVTGISVRAARGPQEEKIHRLAAATAELAGVTTPLPRDRIVVTDDYVGPGYGLPTEGMIEAARLFARLEGILLDPVYTGKTAAGLIDLVRKGEIGPDEMVLFVHTGGSPALYASQETLLD